MLLNLAPATKSAVSGFMGVGGLTLLDVPLGASLLGDVLKLLVAVVSATPAIITFFSKRKKRTPK